MYVDFLRNHTSYLFHKFLYGLELNVILCAPIVSVRASDVSREIVFTSTPMASTPMASTPIDNLSAIEPIASQDNIAVQTPPPRRNKANLNGIDLLFKSALMLT